MPAHKKLVQGRGVNDAPFSVPTNDPIYRYWLRMFYRCYGKQNSSTASYAGCSVDPEWFSFMAFRDWALAQDWEGNQLDKDILVSGNKVYGPETCCFVPRYLNMIGPRLNQPCVSPQKRGKPWGARINCNGKFKWIGSYNTEKEAADAWRKERASDILRLIAKYRSEAKKVDYRVCCALQDQVTDLIVACL